MTIPPITRAQKSPRWAGWFGKIGASTAELETSTAGDFRNLVSEEPKMQRIHISARARVCHPRSLAFHLGGAA